MKKPGKVLIMLGAIIMLGLQPAIAKDLTIQQPTVEYSADETIIVEGMTMISKVCYAPGKIRKEQNIHGRQQISIIRMDKKLMWTLMPNERMYMEIVMDGSMGMQENAGDNFTKNTVVHSVLGDEVVNGVKTTKSEIGIDNPQGGKLRGLMWQSKDGIIMKIETDQMTLELKNLKKKAQDSALFEIPSGYKKMDMQNMMGSFSNFME